MDPVEEAQFGEQVPGRRPIARHRQMVGAVDKAARQPFADGGLGVVAMEEAEFVERCGTPLRAYIQVSTQPIPEPSDRHYWGRERGARPTLLLGRFHQPAS